MRALAFWKEVTVDRGDLLGRLIALLDQLHIRYCVVGGQAVNAYAEPLVSLDLALALAVGELERLLPRLEREFRVEPHAHSINVSLPDSDLRVQFQLDPRYAAFAGRSEPRDVLGERLPVARVEDVLLGKVLAAADPARRSSKRQKDLADIARLIGAFPDLRRQVPEAILRRLVRKEIYQPTGCQVVLISTKSEMKSSPCAAGAA